MGLLKKTFIILLVFSFLFLQIPNTGLAGLYAKANESSKITGNAPQVFSTPEKDLPVVQEAAPSKKGTSWTSVILGILVIGGLVAALAGGGGGGGDSSSSTNTTKITTGTTGNYAFGW